MENLISLKDDEIHLWYLNLSDRLISDFVPPFWGHLQNEEKEKFHHITSGPKKLEYLASRGFLRRLLSKYAEISPDAWRFLKGQHGRPEISNTSFPFPLHFNISHCKGILACALSRDPEIGVDVECVINREQEVLEVAAQVFSKIEMKFLENLDDAEGRVKYFYKIWTLKEAYIKAIGRGFSIDTRDFSVDFASRENPTLFFESSIGHIPERWFMKLIQPTPKHQLAVASGSSGPACHEVIEKWVDLESV